ncbi:carboxymuconolactone decarboxylase family protein [Evansella halocellulosilytica]|uniref:carboxymuconolactone decarboxylase family protein n=1 Tax=Evansella halocellulosilytica TaxID=2011013 RepID=UPI000BB76671|nr:carboxymuconolactone decarboxylase family protein [Evansella halocellulosilytica]
MSSKFEVGLDIRKSVLGEEHVNRSINNATEFNEPIQQLVTEYCWGEVWSRSGLDKKQRSLINLAMLTALNRPHELKLHLKGALRNGCKKEEIREVLLQSAIYCGVPAAVDSFRVASEIIKDLNDEVE